MLIGLNLLFHSSEENGKVMQNPHADPYHFLRVTNTCRMHMPMEVWLSCNALASINVVALRQTRLVPGWVTVCGRVNHLGM